MSTLTHSSRAPSQHPIVANVAVDPIAAKGPWPGMSSRAALIARSLGVAVLFAWLALTDPRLLVGLAFALPFWIAVEIEARFRRARAAPARDGSLLYLQPIGARPSDGRDHRSPSRAA